MPVQTRYDRRYGALRHAVRHADSSCDIASVPPSHVSDSPLTRPIVVLLTDPEQRASLAAARALWQSGHRVLTIGSRAGLAGRSRAVVRHFGIPAAEVSVAHTFRAHIAEVVGMHSVDVILPITDGASSALLGHDSELGAPVAGPSRRAFDRASDKEGLLAAAVGCGLRVPRQEAARDRGAFELLAPRLRAPLVIKPARSVVEVNGSGERQSVRFIDDLDALEKTVAVYPDAAFPLLFQERTIGPGIGVFLLRAGGRTLLRFGHQRLREKPPAGGVSTYREAIEPPASLVAQCEALLDALGYEGAAMVEFKQDAMTGEFVLMEINARLWGSLQLALDAGLDFPTALVAVAVGRAFTAVPQPRAGARSYWELGELDHALALLRRSARELHLPPDGTTGGRAALRSLFDRRLSDKPEVFRWSDPLPFLAELASWLRRR